MAKKLRQVLLLLLLAPVLPILALSPFSHAYVNRVALRKARDEAHKGNPRVNKELLELLSKHEREFVNAGNSADAISTYHVLNGIDLYDYAHNYHPDHAQGVPRFGYTLVNEWYENGSSGPEIVLATPKTTKPAAKIALELLVTPRDAESGEVATLSSPI